jgi:glycine oxidase
VEKFDVAIVGGGLIGCSIAFELSTENLRIIVLDRQQPGQEASWAAAGMLSPSPHSPQDIPLVPLAKESLRLYSEFVREIEEYSGASVSYARGSAFHIFFGSNGEAERDSMISEHELLGLNCESVPVSEARRCENALTAEMSAAVLLSDEGSVEPRPLMDAILAANRNRGVEIRSDFNATSLVVERGRCTGVRGNGEVTAAKQVVMAAGCFSGSIISETKGFPGRLPVRPVRGQMVSLRAPNVSFHRVLRSHRGYLVPRSDGRIVAGSTIEEAGFEKRVTAEGIRHILESAMELCPGLGKAEILETWCGLRPGTPDNLPILGPVECEGLILATGHYRSGILLAPITATLVREWIMQGRTSFDATAFSPLRFKGFRSEGVQTTR